MGNVLFKYIKYSIFFNCFFQKKKLYLKCSNSRINLNTKINKIPTNCLSISEIFL